MKIKELKVCQISKADEFGGGASKVAAQLNTLLNKQGITSTHYVSWAGHGLNQMTKPLYKNFSWLIRRLHYLFKRFGFPEFFPFEYFTIDKSKDIYHFHDLSSAISPLTLYLLLKRNKKVIWTIHDCSPFTGGCLYPMGCEKYKQGCGGCPQIGQWPIDSKFDLTKLGYKIKQKLHSHKNLEIVCPSKWIAGFAEQSGMSINTPKVILNGVNRQVYNSLDKVPEITSYDGLKIILSAGDIADERKGISYSLQVLKQIKDLDPLLVVIGNVSKEFDAEISEYNRLYCGYISEPKKMAAHLASADLFLFCSLADNMPLSVLESLSCATPVFGFQTGGMPEVIKNKFNGYLSPVYDVNSLAKEIRLSVHDQKLEELSTNALLSSEEYDEALLVNRYVELYNGVANV